MKSNEQNEEDGKEKGKEKIETQKRRSATSEGDGLEKTLTGN